MQLPVFVEYIIIHNIIYACVYFILECLLASVMLTVAVDTLNWTAGSSPVSERKNTSSPSPDTVSCNAVSITSCERVSLLNVRFTDTAAKSSIERQT